MQSICAFVFAYSRYGFSVHGSNAHTLFVYLEWVVFDVILHILVIPWSTDNPLDVKDCVFRITCQLILGGISNQPFSVISEGHIRRSDSVTLVVGNDFYTLVLVYANTGGKRSKPLQVQCKGYELIALSEFPLNF